MKTTRLVLAGIASVLSSTGVAFASDLNGVWSCNDGTTNSYYVRQIGNEVWWLGKGTSVPYVNVAFGKYTSSTTIKMRWADVPSSSNSNNGTLTLKIAYGVGTSATMTVVSAIGSWGAPTCSRP